MEEASHLLYVWIGRIESVQPIEIGNSRRLLTKLVMGYSTEKQALLLRSVERLTSEGQGL